MQSSEPAKHIIMEWFFPKIIYREIDFINIIITNNN